MANIDEIVIRALNTEAAKLKRKKASIDTKLNLTYPFEELEQWRKEFHDVINDKNLSAQATLDKLEVLNPRKDALDKIAKTLQKQDYIKLSDQSFDLDWELQEIAQHINQINYRNKLRSNG